MAERQRDVGRSVESSGKTVEEAIENALQRLQLSREQVRVTVLREASRGLLGFGAHDAIVRLTVLGEGETETQPTSVATQVRVEAAVAEAPPPQPAPADPTDRVTQEEAPRTPQRPNEVEPLAPEPDDAPGAEVGLPAPAAAVVEEDGEEWDRPAARETRREVAAEDEGEVARTILLELIERMGVIADVQLMTREPEDDEDHGTLVLDIIGDDLGLLIGRRGDTLNDLQYLTRQLVVSKVGHWVNLVVDVEGYKQRREDRLRQLARRMARRVVDTGRPAHMEPMNSYERRLVHLELRKIDGVETESTGEGERRKVGIFPTGWAD